DTNTSNVPGDFSALILWGDGTSSVGVVSGGAGSFTVSGDHIYFDEGTFTQTVFLSDDAPRTAVGTAVGSVTVAENDTLTASPTTINTTEGVPLTNVVVGSFTDTTYPINPGTDFTDTVDRGDGTT